MTHALRPHAGFTLIEVMVALAIVAIALLAGMQATNALTHNATRQSNVLLAQICAENELTRLRLARQLPPIGDDAITCEQAGRLFSVHLAVRPTPNPNFRRVDAQVFADQYPVLRVTTVQGRN
jgi:general secretion pathway protein I